jgi:hypothetical protein
MLDDDMGESACCDGTYDAGNGGLSRTALPSIVSKMVPGLSMSAGPVSRRVTIVTTNGLKLPEILHRMGIKEASVSAEADYLATEYAKYKLALLTKIASDNDELAVHLGVLQNYV